MSKIVLAYWDIRGLAQPARMLLGYLGEDFEDKMFVCGEAPDYDKTCWTDIKETLGFDFPNLPYLIDGDIKITQSNAIMRYLGRKNGMDGETETEKVRVDIMENQAMDFRNGFVSLCYRSGPAFPEKAEAYKNNVKSILNRFNKFLGDRAYFASEKLTYVDFIMYELLDQHRIFDSTLLEEFGKITAFMKRFAEEPKIASFMKSSKCFKGPINNKMAAFK
jgi:glutathione S-transferase